MNIHISSLGLDFEQIVKNAIQTAHPPIAHTGVAVAVIKNGQLRFAGGFGYRDRATSAPVTVETCFAIGSATKAFTSMAASMYAEESKIALDTPIRQFLPDFQLKDPTAASQTTLLDILCHRTGLAPHNCLWFLGPFTRSQLFYRLRYLEPGTGFRAGYLYNNLMYMVAGYLLESVLGKSYEEIIKTRILDRLEMTATSLSFIDLTSRANHAKGYEQADELALKDFTNIGPAAEINSTVLDMAKWVQLFLRKGVGSNGGVVISQTALELMYSPFTIPDDGTDTAYGLGWTIGKIHENKRLIFHTGDPVGQSAYVSFMPDDGLGVVVLTNQHCTPQMVNHWPDLVATDIYDHLLNGRLTGKLSLPKRVAPSGLGMAGVPPVAVPPLPAVSPIAPAALGDYTGMFSNPGYGDFVVSRSGNSLNISYYGWSWPLLPASDTLFWVLVPAFGTTFPVRVVFAADKSSFAATLVLHPQIAVPFVKR
jgi:CubicO group peptidase (beta-lactamase class C family)